MGYLTYIDGSCIISVKNFIMNSCDAILSVVVCTMTPQVGPITLPGSRQSEGSSDSSDNEKQVPTGQGSFPKPYAFELTSASVN